MDLKELKQVTDELGFLHEGIKRESALLSETYGGLEKQIRDLDNFTVELGKPLAAIQKLVENVNTLQMNIDGAIDTNKTEIDRAALILEGIIETFEKRAGGIVDLIDFSSIESTLSNRLNETVDNVVNSQKNHLEILKKVVISLNAASDKLNRDGQSAVTQIDKSNNMIQNSIKDFNDHVKRFSLLVIFPWVIGSLAVASVITYELTSYHFESRYKDMQNELYSFSERVLPDQYYTLSNDQKTLLMKIPLYDDSRIIKKSRDGKYLFVEVSKK